jgi:multimeric flavodoxin WrbA
MKVVAFDGGSYRQGPVGVRLKMLLDALAAEGVETELLRLEKERRTGCHMCGQCGHKTGDVYCSRPSEDGLRRCVRKIKAADAVIVGTPAYSVRPSPATQQLLNRLDHDWLERDDHRLVGKLAAVVVGAGGDGAGVVAAVVAARLRARGMTVLGQGASPDGGGGSGREPSGDEMSALARALSAALTLDPA